MELQNLVIYFHYKYANHDRIRRVNNFNINTSKLEIDEYISNELGIKSFYLEIQDPRVDFVDFDYKSIRNCLQNQTHNSGVQLANSEPSVVHLFIRQISETETNQHGQSQAQTLSQLCSTSSSSVVHPADERSEASCQTSTTYVQNGDPIFIKNKEDQAIRFLRDLNQTLRDEYLSNGEKTRTGEKVASPVRIQGDKTNLQTNERRKSVLPIIKIDQEIFSNNSTPCLSCYFLLEICENGQRTLYYHPIYEFVDDNNGRTASQIEVNGDTNQTPTNKKPVVLPWNEKYFSDEGHEIELKLRAILGAKTHSNKPTVFYKLGNQYPKDINYNTSRLAILMSQDGHELRDQLLLSRGVLFCHSQNTTKVVQCEIFDNNGHLIESIPKLEVKATAPSMPTEVKDNSRNKKFKTSDKHNTKFQLNQNAQSLNNQLSTHETMQANSQNDPQSALTSMTNTVNILPLPPSNTQDNLQQTICLLNDNNIIFNEQNSLTDSTPSNFDFSANNNQWDNSGNFNIQQLFDMDLFECEKFNE